MYEIEVNTNEKHEMVDITSRVQACVDHGAVKNGLCFVFVPHASACVTLNENEFAVLPREIIQTLSELVPQKCDYKHFNTAEHVKVSLFGNSTTIPVLDGRLVLGSWLGVFLVEWDGPRRPRRVLIEVLQTEGVIQKLTDKRVYSKAKITHGPGGWGGPVIIEPVSGRDLVVSLTRARSHGCARYIADVTGATLFDGLALQAPVEQTIAVVIDSDDMELVSSWIRQGVPVVSMLPTEPSGSLLAAVTESMFVSGVRTSGLDIVRIDGQD